MTQGKEYFHLEGVRIYELKVFPDDRGFFAEVLRQDWYELLDGEWIVQANISLLAQSTHHLVIQVLLGPGINMNEDKLIIF
jgi:dTDP-4-dehydrorhamnose 3,5-epimerase-like enzyme